MIDFVTIIEAVIYGLIGLISSIVLSFLLIAAIETDENLKFSGKLCEYAMFIVMIVGSVAGGISKDTDVFEMIGCYVFAVSSLIITTLNIISDNECWTIKGSEELKNAQKR